MAISNTFVADLIARDLAGAPLAGHAAMYDQIFHSFYDNTMALYLDQYALFGNAEVLPVNLMVLEYFMQEKKLEFLFSSS